MKRIFRIALIMMALSFAWSLPSNAESKVCITVRGAYSMWGRVRSIAMVYSKDHPQVEVSVYSHSVVGEGIRMLIDGKADVAMASRHITPGESREAKAKGVKLDRHLIGYGAIVIITDKQNPVSALSVEQVKMIMTGKILNWKELGGKDQAITVVKCSEKLHPGTSYFIENSVLGGVPVARGAVTLPDFPGVVQKVGETRGAIAFVRSRDPFPGSNARTSIVKIKKDEHSPSIHPTRATISDGTYPLRRPYFLYTTATAGKDVRGFVDFAVTRGWGQPALTHVWQ
ncbi:MAG: substrate-binding domain-containing protein [Syntrophobacteraceae bacterium]|nr:substrate-binding domain-containing protein [Syntrophobacteraceae bacterium]